MSLFEIDDEVEPDTPATNTNMGQQPYAPPPETYTATSLEGHAPVSTLDESVYTSILRDATRSYHMLIRTLGYRTSEPTRDWDLWGPLVFSMLYSLLLCYNASPAKRVLTFSWAFSMVWAGQGLVTFNIRMLGGSVSYLNAMCIAGYALFPLLLLTLFTLFVGVIFLRLPVFVLACVWATSSAWRGLSGAGVLPSRLLLAAYPVGLYYTILGWWAVVA